METENRAPRPGRPASTWAVLIILAALVSTNAVLLPLARTGGPLVGMVFYGILVPLVLRGRRHAYAVAIIGGLAGLGVHIVEVAIGGWSPHPILMGLNLGLPAALAPTAWYARRQTREDLRRENDQP